MTIRAVAAGAVLVLLLAVVTPYSDLELKGTWVAACHLPVGAFVLLLLLTLVVRPLLRTVSRPAAPSSAELTVIYAMMLVGAGIPSFGFAAYLIPTLAGVAYFASPENAWATWFYRFIPQWLVPFDLSAVPGSPVPAPPGWYRLLPTGLRPAEPGLIRQFYEGLPGSQPVPYGPWLVPLAAWTLLAGLLFLVYYGLAVLLRRQWVERERLTFPLVQLPVELLREPGGLWPPLLRQPALWVGFAIPQLAHLVNGLHFYLPAVPELRLRHDLTPLFAAPWNQLGIFWLWIHFSVIGLTFLIPADFSFSLWFFYLVFKLEGMLLVRAAIPVQFMPNYPVPRYAGLQMLGAFAVLAGYLLHAARPHLREAWRLALRPAGEDEPQSYRLAFGEMGVGLLGAAGVLSLAGLPLGLALLVIVLLLVVVMVLTRVIAEGGLLFIQAPFRPTDMLFVFVSSSAVRPRSLTALAFFERVFAFDLRATLWPYLMDSFRLADGPRLPRRPLTAALWLAAGLSTIASCAALLHFAYRNGAVTQQSWFMINSPQQPFQLLATQLGQPTAPRSGDLLTVGLGGAAMLSLCLLRSAYAGFPLHPLGYAMGPSWPLIQLWFSLFIGWLCKTSVLRWGGMKGYRAAWPLFLGLVLGEFTAAGIWIAIGVLAGSSYRFLLT